MPSNPRSLSLHRNTLERRHKKLMRQEMRKAVDDICQRDVRAFAIVAFDQDGRAHAAFDTGSIMPLWGFAPVVGEALGRAIDQSDVRETWRPSLNERTRPGEA